jgi:hypothetical protein
MPISLPKIGLNPDVQKRESHRLSGRSAQIINPIFYFIVFSLTNPSLNA